MIDEDADADGLAGTSEAHDHCRQGEDPPPGKALPHRTSVRMAVFSDA